jgi:hypothetical protein
MSQHRRLRPATATPLVEAVPLLDQRHKRVVHSWMSGSSTKTEWPWRRPYEEIRALKDQLYRENLALRDEVDRASMFEEIVGTSKPLRDDCPPSVGVDQLFTSGRVNR